MHAAAETKMPFGAPIKIIDVRLLVLAFVAVSGPIGETDEIPLAHYLTMQFYIALKTAAEPLSRRVEAQRLVNGVRYALQVS